MNSYHITLLFCFLTLLVINGCKDSLTTGNNNLVKLLDEYQMVKDSLDKSYENGWGPGSIEHFNQLRLEYTQILESLLAMDVSKLKEDSKINRELLILELKNELEDLNFESYLMPLNAEGGFLTGIVYWAQKADASNKEKYEKYISKLKSLPQYLDFVTDLMRTGIQKGKTSPEIITIRCLDLLKKYTDTPLEKSFLLLPFSIKDTTNDAYFQAVKIIQTEVIPAYSKFTRFVETEYLDASKKEPGISNLVGGKEYYESKIKYYTTLEMTPEEVFSTGESEVERIRAEMVAIISKTGFKGDFPAFLEYLRKDPQFYAKTPRELLYKATWLSKKIEGKLPVYFNKLPRMPFVVEPVPDAIAPNYTGGRYSEGSYKTGKPGAYWVNTYKLESRPLYVLPALTLHEAVPGHHLQIMLSRELENVPKFRENLYISAFGEGWGLYSEYLGVEAGMYETDYEHFGRLTYEMWRACRLVVDVGLHYKGWSRDQAALFMASNTALSMHEVNTEIDRYIGWPGQAVSYKIGEIKIKELRQKAEKELGNNFDIRSFHDLLLSKGSVSLSILENMVDGYISSALIVK